MSGLTQPMYNILLLACKRNERERSFVRSAVSPTVNLPALFYHCNAHTTRRGGGGVYDMRQRFLLYLLEPSEMSGRVTICGGDGSDGGRERGTHTEAEGGEGRDHAAAAILFPEHGAAVKNSTTAHGVFAVKVPLLAFTQEGRAAETWERGREASASDGGARVRRL